MVDVVGLDRRVSELRHLDQVRRRLYLLLHRCARRH
jgi:hypothetical protein